MEFEEAKIREALKRVIMPGDSSDIVISNKLKSIEIKEKEVNLTILLSEKKGQYKSAIKSICEDTIKRFAYKDADIKVYYEIPKSEINEKGGITGVKHIIAVASGKGGVGKSTIAANLAVSLQQKGYKTGLLDADIFGPSVPKMFGVEGLIPEGVNIGEKEYILPIEKYGIKLLSIGFFVDPKNAVAWRGPMAGKALSQLINDAEWGELDFLILDMPPGTSDIHLSTVQILPLTGAVIVTTPQDVAVIDAVKGIDLFRKENINVPVLGLVENMSWFTPEELPNNKYYIFGKAGGEKLCKEQDIPFLGNIPIVLSVRESGDMGKPVPIDGNAQIKKIFDDFTENVLYQIQKRIENLPPTKVVNVFH